MNSVLFSVYWSAPLSVCWPYSRFQRIMSTITAVSFFYYTGKALLLSARLSKTDSFGFLERRVSFMNGVITLVALILAVLIMVFSRQCWQKPYL